jgi:hypothetical protein
VIGYGDGKYIVGNLRRQVSSGIAYNFPMGTAAHFELAELSIAAHTGLTSIDVLFTESTEVVPGGLTVLGQPVTNFLNYGYWSFTPNAGVTAVNYTTAIHAKGHADLGGNADNYALFTNEGAGWQDLGTHNLGLQTYTSTIVTAKRQLTNILFGKYIVGHAATSLRPKIVRVKGATIKVAATATATISGSDIPLTNSAGGAIKVAALGSLIADGNVTNTTSATFKIEGTMTADGNVTNEASSSFQIDGLLDVNGNWTNDGVASLALAGGTNGTVEFSGATAQQLGGSTPSIFEKLEINNTAGVTLLGNQEVADSLIFTNGIITTGTNRLEISSPVDGVIGYGDGKYIVGNLRRQVSSGIAYNFPMGTAAHFELAELSIATHTGLTSIDVSFTESVETAPGGLSVLGQPVTDLLDYGYWTLEPNAGVTAVSYTVGIQSKGHTDLGGDADNYALFTDEGSDWEDLGTHSLGLQIYTSTTVSAQRQLTNVLFGKYIVGYTETSLRPKIVHVKGAIVKIAATATATISGNKTTLNNSNSGTIKIDGILALAGGLNNEGTTSFESTGGSIGTVKLIGTNVQDLGGTVNTTFENLTIDNVAGVTLSKNQEVKGVLTLTNGVITTGANVLNCSNTDASAITGHSNLSFVNGNLKKAIDASGTNTDTYGLPVGNGTASTNYFLAEFMNNKLTGVSALNVSVAPIVVAAPNDNANLPVITQDGTTIASVIPDAQWTIAEVGAYATGSYGVKLYLENFTTVNASHDNYMCPLKRDNGATYADWKTFDDGSTTIPPAGAPGRVYSGGAGYIERTGYQSFSLHAVGLGALPLPIELLSFDAQLVNDEVELKWTTTTEINNDYFTVERSQDAQTFTPLITVDGAGNSNQVINYESFDTSPLNGKSYYRLKQTDFNGDFSYSAIVAISTTQLIAKNPSIKVYPNPSTGEEIYLEFSGYLAAEKVHISLHDALGKVYLAEKIRTNANGSFTHKVFPYEKLISGTYFITGLSNNKISHKKLIIQ